MIIGLNGRLKSGKDTTFGIIQQIMAEKNHPLPVIQVSFAKALKASAAASIGSNVVNLENWKGDEEVGFTRPDGTTFTAREYLQWYGTEGHRDLFGDDFWVDQAMPINKNYYDALYVVTDMRFPNEAERVLFLSGRTVKVVREADTKFSAHASEQNIDHMIQYFLDNTSTLDVLKLRVEEMLELFGVFDETVERIEPDVQIPGQVTLFPPYASATQAEDMRGWIK